MPISQALVVLLYMADTKILGNFARLVLEE
jgi:hypothetical protein